MSFSLVELNCMQKRDVSELVEAIKVLQPGEKFMILKALNDKEELSNKDIKIMEWALDVMKDAKKAKEELEKGLEVLERAVERQNKKWLMS